MAGASDVTSSLADKAALNGAWRTEFLAVSEREAAEKLVDIDKKLRPVHTLQGAAFDELLRYWSDARLTITKGTDMFKDALQECDATIKELTAELDSFRLIK